jgi:hypothetical protein
VLATGQPALYLERMIMKRLSEFIRNTDSSEVVKLYIPVVELEDRIAELEAEKQNLNNCLNECRAENERLKAATAFETIET